MNTRDALNFNLEPVQEVLSDSVALGKFPQRTDSAYGLVANALQFTKPLRAYG